MSQLSPLRTARLDISFRRRRVDLEIVRLVSLHGPRPITLTLVTREVIRSSRVTDKIGAWGLCVAMVYNVLFSKADPNPF